MVDLCEPEAQLHALEGPRPPVALPNYLTYSQQNDAQTLSSGAHASEAHVVGRLLTRRRYTND